MRATKCAVVSALAATLSVSACGTSKSQAKPPEATGGSASASPSASSTYFSEHPADKLRPLLLVDADLPGYTMDPTAEGDAVTIIPTEATRGGAACQTFLDSLNGVASVYGTTAEVDRTLKDLKDKQFVLISIKSFPSAAKAKDAIAGLAVGSSGCSSLAASRNNIPVIDDMIIQALPNNGTFGEGAVVFSYGVPGAHGFQRVAGAAQIGSTTVTVTVEVVPTTDKAVLLAGISTLDDALHKQCAKADKPAV